MELGGNLGMPTFHTKSAAEAKQVRNQLKKAGYDVGEIQRFKPTNTYSWQDKSPTFSFTHDRDASDAISILKQSTPKDKDWASKQWPDAYAKLYGRRKANGFFSNSPDSEEAAKELAREFHGRDNREVYEVVTLGNVPKNLAMLGILIELQVWISEAFSGEYLPLNFAPEHPVAEDEDNVLVGGINKNDRGRIYFIGGDQQVDVEDLVDSLDLELSIEDALEADSINLGPVKSIAYFADKHHLEGPSTQKKGIPYEHQFAINEETGEQVGEPPELYYWPNEQRFELKGGSYEILPEGISG